MEKRKPETEMGDKPIWCHHKGTGMRLITASVCNDLLIIQGSAAELIIEKDRSDWLVSWRIINGPRTQIKGQTQFSDNQLLAAFGMMDEIEEFGEWLIRDYGGDSASQGRFIRYKDWLNIPCPGTRHDGDPNISIKITEEMKKAVKELVYYSR